MRIGIVGFGTLARQCYVPVLRAASVHVAAVADPLPSSREAALRAFPGARVGPDAGAMLELESMDAVLVSGPPSSHLAAVQAASARGLATFVEKPFLAPGDLARFVSPHPARLAIDFNRRFWPAYQEASALVREGAVGEARGVEIVMRTDPERWSRVTAHRALPAEGGILFDLGSQALDLIHLFLRAEPTRFEARAHPTQAALSLFFPDGVEARCHLSYGRGGRERVTIVGTTGQVVMENPNMGVRLEPSRAHARWLARGRGLCRLAHRALVPSRRMLRASVAATLGHFLDAARGGAAFTPGLQDALRNATWLEAAAAAAREA